MQKAHLGWHVLQGRKEGQGHDSFVMGVIIEEKTVVFCKSGSRSIYTIEE